MRLIKEEHHLRLFGVSALRQFFKQLAHQKQHERCIQRRILHKLHAVQHVYVSPALLVALHPVAYIYRRFAEEFRAAFILKRYKAPLYRAQALRAHVSVFRGKLRPVFANVAQHGLKILYVYEQQLLIVRNFEHKVQYVALHVAQVHQPAQKHRPHFAHGCPYGVAVFAVYIPKPRWKHAVAPILYPKLIYALFHAFAVHARLAHAGKVSLYVRKEHRHAQLRKGLRQHLERYCFARAACAGNKAVSVGSRNTFSSDFASHIFPFSSIFTLLLLPCCLSCDFLKLYRTTHVYAMRRAAVLFCFISYRFKKLLRLRACLENNLGLIAVFFKQGIYLRAAHRFEALYELNKLLVIFLLYPRHIRPRLAHARAHPVKAYLRRVIQKEHRISRTSIEKL